ncbi:MAG TPA: DUF2278 family protein [Chloroflexia bacterium]|nr:DUF2278 family protein [Chloroflexia bacterium]
MPINNYGVFKGRVIDGKRETGQDTPHYQIHLLSNNTHYRVAVNVKSQESPSELLYLLDTNFRHPVTGLIAKLPSGFTSLQQQKKPGGLALDFIRGNLFHPSDMKLLPYNVPGADNDLSDLIEHYVLQAKSSSEAEVCAFGQRWGPEPKVKDKIFGFLPGNGIHDIHMNQGNSPQFAKDDGVYQDGALIFHFPATNEWVALFLAFQSQAWHTDDQTGHAIVTPEVLDKEILIVAALVNPAGTAKQNITLLNTSPERINLTGWSLADITKTPIPLSGIIEGGATRQIELPANLRLDSHGGIITLLNGKELKVHGVSYTQEQTKKKGWTTVFK